MTNSVIKVIDPHLHLFNLQQGDYHWLKPGNEPFWPDKPLVHKNFSQSDLGLSWPLELAGFVHIEAGFDNQHPWREVDWLEQHCSLTFRSVAFADITANTFTEHLEKLTQRQSVVGIRYILDEHAQTILGSPYIHQHFALLAQAKFNFDAQLSLADDLAIEKLVVLANQHQTVPIVINHGGWPPDKQNIHGQTQWQSNLLKLRDCQNIAIKLSGWEMINRAWRAEHLSLLVQNCIKIMGEDRVMLASNFPLCLFSLSYQGLWKTYAELPAISSTVFSKLAYDNAKRWYKLT